MKTAMILAAGRGERLKPLTDTIPKALCAVHRVPLIEHHIRRLSQAGFTRVIVNHAYLGGKIRQHLQDGRQWGIEVVYSPEPPGGLETGGGIVNALPLLGQDPFLVVNADVYSDYPFQSPVFSQDLARLILIPSQKTNQPDFGLSETGQVTNFHRSYTYAGISWFHPALFQSLKVGRYSLTPLLRGLAEDGVIQGEIYNGRWLNIETVARLQKANG